MGEQKLTKHPELIVVIEVIEKKANGTFYYFEPLKGIKSEPQTEAAASASAPTGVDRRLAENEGFNLAIFAAMMPLLIILFFVFRTRWSTLKYSENDADHDEN